jgi:hypothetical protein
MIHPTYLPFTRDELRPHFLADSESHIEYFEKSAARYVEFLAQNPITTGIALSKARGPRQIERDELFWTAATLKHLFDHPQRGEKLCALLARCFGDAPPLQAFATWADCVNGEIALYFEAQFPSPKPYKDWLSQNLSGRHIIPYVFDAAARSSARPLEGPTHVDAMIVNSTNGFSLMVESKVLSDSSCNVSFDCLRNQLTRNIDIMLEPYPNLGRTLNQRVPKRSLFCILTPQIFREHPESRHYGGLIAEYRANVGALVRDLPHRSKEELHDVPNRLGWMTFEDVLAHFPDACPWIKAA